MRVVMRSRSAAVLFGAIAMTACIEGTTPLPQVPIDSMDATMPNGGDGDGGPGDIGDGDNGDGDGDNGGMDAGGLDASLGDGGPVGGSRCDVYCDVIMRNCTGQLQQYPNKEQCLRMCPDFLPGEIGDKSGNSLECRIYHAYNVETLGEPGTHCPHAGPTGGNTCGLRCESFCQLAEKQCNPDRDNPSAYASEEVCLETCVVNPEEPGSGYATDFSGGEFTPSGDTLNCRFYHLTNTYLNDNPDTPKQHCPHVSKNSSTCLPAPDDDP